MQNTKCPAVYRNLGLETFGNKKKVTEEMLKQFCKNDEYLYQKIRILLDLTDPESRKRFHPPYYDYTAKSFGYTTGEHDGKECFQFDNGGEYRFGVDFTTRDDDVFVKEGITYYNDETITNYDKMDGVEVLVTDSDEAGFVRILEVDQEEITEPGQQPIWSEPEEASSTTKQVTKKIGKAKLDSFCYGPYGAMKPNGWWYVGFDKDKNYNVKAKWKKNPYKEGIPTKCRAQTFTARHTGYITKVNINVITESNKKTASPFSCEIWKTKKGVPYGGPIARVEQTFKDSNAYSGAHIKTFKFGKKAVVTKGHKYAIVMRSPLSHEGACYRIAGWPRTCYTNYMKGSYYYGYAFQSLDNGKTWIRYDKNAYGKLHTSKSTMPIAFGFEVYVQPTKTTIKSKKKPATEKKIIGYEPIEKPTGEYRSVYSTGNHYVYFKLPVTNPIYQLTIDEGISENRGINGNEIYWDISYNGEDFNTNDLIDDSMGRGTGDYDLSNAKPTFVMVRANLFNTDKYQTPILRSVKFTVHTYPSRKAYVRSLPYCPESETMLPACIWSEVNADYEEENGASVKVDVIKETDAQQTFRIRTDTLQDLWEYYREFYSTQSIKEFSSDDAFRETIQKDEDFINHLKYDLEPSVYVISSYPSTHEKYFEYFESFELRNYPAYPMVSCNKVLGEMIMEVEDFKHSNFDPEHHIYLLTLNRDLSNDLLSIVFREPQNANVYDNESNNQEGVIEDVLIFDPDYTLEGGFNDGKDYAILDNKRTIVFNLFGENFSKHIVYDEVEIRIKCFKLSDGTLDTAEADTDYVDDEYSATQINITTGDVIELVLNMQDKAFEEHINYTVDYNNKLLTPRPSMRKDLSSSDLVVTYNPLWVRDLTSEVLPLKMDMWTEYFVVTDDYRDKDGNVVYTTRVAPRDNLREVVLFDDEDSLTRNELIEDIDFVVDYQKNKIVFDYPIENDTPITIRYTPNLTETSLSLGYRMDRNNDETQAYLYSNYFTTRT